MIRVYRRISGEETDSGGSVDEDEVPQVCETSVVVGGKDEVGDDLTTLTRDDVGVGSVGGRFSGVGVWDVEGKGATW